MDKLPTDLPITCQQDVDCKQMEINYTFVSSVEQLDSMSKGFVEPEHHFLIDILRSSDKLSTFEEIKYQLDSNVRRIFSSVLKCEYQFQFYYDDLMNSDQVPLNFCQEFSVILITLGTPTTQRRNLERIIDKRQYSGNPLMAQVMNDFVVELIE